MPKHEEPAYPEDFKAHLAALTRICGERTGHGEYNVTFRWSDKPHAGDMGRNSETRASIKMETVYLWIQITVFPGLLDDWIHGDYELVGGCILHELCHLFLEPVMNLFMWDASASQRGHFVDTMERQVQRIANAIGKSMPDKWFVPEIRKTPIRK